MLARLIKIYHLVASFWALFFILWLILAQLKRTAHGTALEQHAAGTDTQLYNNSAYIAPPYNPNLQPKYNPPLGGV